ncbi:MAG: hypothetical protein Q9164_006733 [Protoblastenia rupestris]
MTSDFDPGGLSNNTRSTLRNRLPKNAQADSSEDMTREYELTSTSERLRNVIPPTEVSNNSFASSSDEQSDDAAPGLDEEALLSQDDKTRPRGGWSPPKRKNRRASAKGKARDEPQAPDAKRKGGLLRNWIFWLIVTLIATALLLWLLLSMKKGEAFGPKDGLSPPWYPTPLGGTLREWRDSYEKASKMVEKMSLVEKVNVTTGTGWGMNLCVGNTGSANNVGFPMLCLQDGPLGIRFADHATYWPAGITAAATWNKDLIYRRGKGLGKEHRLKGVNIALGPSMGPLGRMPAGGRNWEGFGPDPVLAGIAAAETIRGIQEEGVMATAKHYIVNEQEHFRQPGVEWGVPYALSSNIDDRTLHELYLWPFQDSIKAGVASIMCSYNMVNSSYTCGNSKLMNGILKDELGFQGFVQSDWLAQRSGVASALAGLDMSMPGDGPLWADGNSFWGPNMTEAALNGSLPMQRVNDMTTRVVAAWYQLGQDNETVWPKPLPGEDARPNFSSFTDEKEGRLHPDSDDDSTTTVNKFVNVQGTGEDYHAILAQEVAAEGTVLVKNEDAILPLKLEGWSGQEKPEGDVPYRVGIFGEDAGRAPDKDGKEWPNQCEDRGCNEGTLATGWGSGSAVFPFLVTPSEAILKEFDSNKVKIEQSLTNDVKNVSSDITNQDLCLVFVNSDAGEGFIGWEGLTDRKDLYPQKGGDELVKRVAKDCENTVVVVHAVGAVILERWVDHPNVRAVVLANLPGEASGDALVDVLFGKVDASGRLPYTVGRSLPDYGPGGQVMYKSSPSIVPQQDFDEGLLIDYRHFDHQNVTPRYAFGFGLSYTTWEFSKLDIKQLKPKSPFPSPRKDTGLQPPSFSLAIPDKTSVYFPAGFRRLKKYVYPYLDETITINKAEYPYPEGYNMIQPPSQAGGGEGGNPSLWDEHLLVSVNVKNSGSRKGKQVVQVYLSFPENVIDDSTGAKIEFPVRVLRAFEKIEVEKGETRTVEIKLTRRDLSYWSVGRQNWVMPTEGKFEIAVGTSSSPKDLLLKGTWN